MQDYLFQTRRKSSRRWLLTLFKLFILVALVGGAYIAFERFYSANESKEDSNLLPLPPIEQTQPLSKKISPAPTIPIVDETDTDLKKNDQHVSDQIFSQPNPSSKSSEQNQAEPKIKSKQMDWVWKEYRIQKGDRLISWFKQQGLDADLLNRLISSSRAAKQLNHILPGQVIKIKLDADGQLDELVLIKDRIDSLHIKRQGKKYITLNQQKKAEKKIRAISGTIHHSFYQSAQSVGLSRSKSAQLVRLFSAEINFQALHKGDQFRVVYEEYYQNGQKVKEGPILAAQFINRGKQYTAIRYKNKQGQVAYYDAQGRSKKNRFLRYPVKFKRISSKFTKKRWHPVLKKWRSHKGVDFAAPRGTPVKASGDGIIQFIGRQNGYGRVIYIKHDKKYTTVYGHLSRFARGMKKGRKVKQGQIIAYVGSSGLATGPHLHYEFRVNGVQKDPLKLKLPNTIELPHREKKRFKQKIQPLIAQLNALKAKQMLASRK